MASEPPAPPDSDERDARNAVGARPAAGGVRPGVAKQTTASTTEAPASEARGGPERTDPREPKSEPPGPDAKRGRFETRLPGLIRRGIEKGIEAGLITFEKSMETTDAVREVFSDVKIPDVASAVGKALQEAKLPREIAGAVLNQLDETKNDVVRIIAREVRDFLEATDLAGEIKNALTSLSFEVRTEVRFIPNDAGTGVRPDVRARGRVKRAVTRDRRTRRGRREDDEEHEPDEP